MKIERHSENLGQKQRRKFDFKIYANTNTVGRKNSEKLLNCEISARKLLSINVTFFRIDADDGIRFMSMSQSRQCSTVFSITVSFLFKFIVRLYYCLKMGGDTIET